MFLLLSHHYGGCLSPGACSEKDLVAKRGEGKKPKKYVKPGESREAKPVLVAPADADGRVRHVISIDEKLVAKEELAMAVGGRVFLFVGSG